MNEVFIWLYLGDITEKVTDICVFGIALFVVVIVIAAMIREERLVSDETRNSLAKLSNISKWIIVFFFILGVLMPSKFFFYTLAGAKAGEVTISSEIGKKAIEALNIQLDEYIKEIKDKEAK